MTLEVAAPVVLLVIAAVVVVQTQLLSPRLTRRRFNEELILRGWTERIAAGDQEWNDIMALAIEGNQGPETVREYDKKFGPFRTRSRHSTKRSGKALKIYRDTATTRHRYAAVGKKIERHDERSGFFPLIRRKRYSYTMPEIWIGEARRIPVKSPEVAFHWFGAEFGGAARKLVIRQDLDPERIPAIASPAENSQVRAIREIIRESSLASALKITAYVGPRSWVLSVPLNHVKKRSRDILDLAQKISESIDRVSRFVQTGE